MLAMLAACAPSRTVGPAARPAPEPERLGGSVLLGEEIRQVDGRFLGGGQYDLPVEANSWVQAELDFLTRDRRDVVSRWLERGERYEEFVKEVMREQGLPTDLYHLALIESGFVPSARSRAGAVGVWQFMPATSRDVGLRVDEVVDERMDPVRSTRAAARHLRALFRIHGDWALAAAAYNAGSTRIRRSLQAAGATGFWDLAQRGDLAAETQQYVPRLYAMTIIGRDRERFGFARNPAAQSFAFDSIHVDRGVRLADLAGLIAVEPERLEELNPHFLQGTVPENGYWVWVPAGRGADMQRAYLVSQLRQRQELAFLSSAPDAAASTTAAPATPPATGPAIRPAPQPPPAREGGETHRVQTGDTLWQLAQQYGVSLSDLQAANGIAGSVIVPGQQLTIPPRAAGAGAGAPAPTEARTTEHVVQPGDTLWGIARRYGSSIAAIERENSLGERPIIPGQRLTVPLQPQ